MLFSSPAQKHFVRNLILLAFTCAVAPAFAGQIYGTLVSQGKPLAKTDILITCAGEETKGASTEDGSFKIAVAKAGRCTFALSTFPGAPSATIFSQPKPAMYDFDLAKDASGKYELRIR